MVAFIDDLKNQPLWLLIVILIVVIAGLVIHSFIIGVNVNDWWKGRSVTAVDYTVTSVCISRMCVQCVVFVYFFVATLPLTNQYSQVIIVIFLEVYIILTYANFWLTTVLSIVFCVKISNLHTRLLLHLRRMIEERTVCFIVAPVLLSAFSGLMSLPTYITMVRGKTNNATMDDTLENCMSNNSIYIYTIGTFFPLLFCCTSSVLLFTSLYHHTQRMKRSSNLTINLETYYSVMKFVSFTFIYNILYFSGHFGSIFHYNFYCVNIPCINLVMGFLQVVHSSYLIYRIAKLRSQMFKSLQNVINFVCQRKDRETRENLEVVKQ